MGILDTIKNLRVRTPVSVEPEGMKAAFDLQRVGIQGRPQYPDTDIDSLLSAYKRNEMVYAAIDIKATSAVDPRLIVQSRSAKDEWAEVDGHPLRRLMMKPNPHIDEAGFMRAYIVSLDVAGIFYAEIVRGANKLPIALHPLNPAKVLPVPGPKGTIDYQFKDGTDVVIIKGEDMLVKRLYNPTSRYHGLSPLSVCLGSVDADSAQTDYLRAFFNNAGVPSGIITVKNRKLTQTQADDMKARWMQKYSRAWGRQHDVAILDEDASYQKIGANLDELNSEAIRSFTESRIAMVFKVPPLIIYSYTGLLRATYSNLKEAWRSFWDATLTPLFKEYRAWLTWSLLPQFVSEDLVFGERIRLNWDMSQVAALQDDVDAIQLRARENFKAGGITLNQFREAIGEDPDSDGDYYVRSIAQITQPANQPIDEGLPALAAPPKMLMLKSGREQKASRQTLERRQEKKIARLIMRDYTAMAEMVRSAA